MRYIPHTDAEIAEMLERIGAPSLDALIEHIPAELRATAAINAAAGISEPEVVARLSELAEQNAAGLERCFAGAGAYPHFSPSVVDHVLTRAEFASAYTPYQPEVSQGTLQAIFEFQTLIAALYGMEVSNASLYDGASATAEAVLMLRRLRPKSGRVLVARSLPSAYRQVIDAYVSGLPDLELVEIGYGSDGRIDLSALDTALEGAPAGLIVGYPNGFGVVEDLATLRARTEAAGVLLATTTPESLALALLRPPGAFDVDVAVGEGQSFGIPMSFGGPYVGLLTTREKFVRSMPGRVASETVDDRGRRGFVLTLSTREQHIRREKATSNICTNQGLCSLAATVYLSLAGRRGLREIAERNTTRARHLARRLTEACGAEPLFDGPYFNEVAMRLPRAQTRRERAGAAGFVAGTSLEGRFPELTDGVLFCATEVHSDADVEALIQALGD